MKVFSETTRMRMSESAKARCTPEWRARQRVNRETVLDTDMVLKLYMNGHTQGEIGAMMGVSQKTIWRHMKNHGIEARPCAKRNQCGQNNSNWRGGRIISDGGYVMIANPKHPRAKVCGGYVPEHVLVVEASIGRFLNWHGVDDDRSEIVHHINQNKQDNRLENLRIVSYRKHMRIHNKLRRLSRGGDNNAIEE